LSSQERRKDSEVAVESRGGKGSVRGWHEVWEGEGRWKSENIQKKKLPSALHVNARRATQENKKYMYHNNFEKRAARHKFSAEVPRGESGMLFKKNGTRIERLVL